MLRVLVEYINFARPDASGIPDWLREGLDALHQRVTQQGSYDATVAAMTEDEASDVALIIVELDTRLEDLGREP